MRRYRSAGRAGGGLAGAGSQCSCLLMPALQAEAQAEEDATEVQVEGRGRREPNPTSRRLRPTETPETAPPARDPRRPRPDLLSPPGPASRVYNKASRPLCRTESPTAPCVLSLFGERVRTCRAGWGAGCHGDAATLAGSFLRSAPRLS